jgi:hypothetical protein
MHDRMDLTTYAQYERWRFPVLDPKPHNNFTFQLQVTFRPPVKEPPAKSTP